MKNYETILPFSCCPLVFPDFAIHQVFALLIFQYFFQPWDGVFLKIRHASQSPPKGAGKLVPRENCRKCRKTFWRFFDDV